MVFYFATEYQTIQLIVFTHDLLGKEVQYGKGKNIDKIKEGNIGKLIREYIPIIGVDNILDSLNELKELRKKVTLKDVEKKFKSKE